MIRSDDPRPMQRCEAASCSLEWLMLCSLVSALGQHTTQFDVDNAFEP